MRVLWAVALVLPVMAGCLAPDETPCADRSEDDPCHGPAVTRGAILGDVTNITFTPQRLIDTMRSGGEPVIAITEKGVIVVSSHPGYTHVHPSQESPNAAPLLVPSQGQSYLWRSADNGSTWTHVSVVPVPLPNSGPRGAAQGVSDPEFTIDGNGRIWHTDLEALASASVSYSDDDGATWVVGNNAASQGPIDRQWLASYKDEMFFTGNFFVDSKTLVTKDAINYERREGPPCNSDLLANPVTGTLYVSCPDQAGTLGVSKDGAKSWKKPKVGDTRTVGPIGAEPGIDANGTVYVVGMYTPDDGSPTFKVFFTKDDGATWGNFTFHQFFPSILNGTWIWPWVSAGSEGRLAVTFMASETADAQDQGGDWFIYTALITNATDPHPVVYPVKVTAKPFHTGHICQGGTGCQITTAIDEGSDRRLGDFFETTIDHMGYLHIVHADTELQPLDSVAHVGYEKMLTGPRLVVGPVPKGFPTQG